MRLHRHQTGKASSRHSVRLRHDHVWDWCAHHEEVQRHLQRRRRLAALFRADRALQLKVAH